MMNGPCSKPKSRYTLRDFLGSWNNEPYHPVGKEVSKAVITHVSVLMHELEVVSWSFLATRGGLFGTMAHFGTEPPRRSCPRDRPLLF